MPDHLSALPSSPLAVSSSDFESPIASDHLLNASEDAPSLKSVYKVRLKQGQLLVRPVLKPEEIHLLSSRSVDFLAEWINYSPARLIRIAPEFGEARLQDWASLGQRSSKTVFLNIPRHPRLPKHHSPIAWSAKRMLDWVAAAGLLVLLTPLLLLLGLGVWREVRSPNQILLRQWRVGARGQLFEIYKFRTSVPKAAVPNAERSASRSQLGRWLCKTGLDELPQLLNVLKGEMSLVGLRPWALADSLKISPANRHHLNALPGMIGDRQVQRCAHLRESGKVVTIEPSDRDLHYLANWSLWQDAKILLSALPKLLARSNFD